MGLDLPEWKIISFKRNEYAHNAYDVEMHHLQELKRYSSMECHVVLYPYSKKINRDDYTFEPFEEYIKDLNHNHRSAYAKIDSPAKEFFGIFLGLLIIAIFLDFKPSALISVDAVVGILGAYFIGKDLWDDIENFLMNISKDWRLNYQDEYYSYRLDRHTTLTQYTHLAKKNRYGKDVFLPDRMECIEHHNSTTARMYFEMSHMRQIGDNAHLFSVNMAPSLVKQFEKEGCMLGIKLSLNRKFLFFETGIDLLQSMDNGKKGCLDKANSWRDNTIHYRKLWRICRLRFYREKGYLENRTIIE